MTPAITKALVAAVMTVAVTGEVPPPLVDTLPALPDTPGLAGAFAGVHSGHLLAAGGANVPGGRMPWDGGTKVWHDRMLALAPDAGSTWRGLGRLPAPNAYGVSVTAAEGVLVIGGGNAVRSFADVWLMTFDGGSLAFRALPPLPTPLAQMAGALVGRRVHVAGGSAAPDATEASSRHYRLDLDAIDRGWQELPPLPSAGRILAIAGGVGNAFYVMGGCSLAPGARGGPVRTYRRDAWRFSDGGWTRLADLPTPLAAAASPAPVFGEHVYVISGDDGTQAGLASPARHTGFSRRILRYDTVRNAWHHAGDLGVPPPVTLPTAPWANGFALLNGEVRPGVRSAQVLFFRLASR